jgi:hypothetical protein
MMQGSKDQPDFESDFGFLFDDFQRVVEWATGFLLFRFDGRRIGFFFLISGDWVIVGLGGLDVSRKYCIYTILGEKKKTEQNRFCFFFFLFFLKEE